MLTEKNKLMKKIFILSMINIFLAVSIFAQEEEAVAPVSNISLASKNGIKILPTAGDFALGADALPFLRYVGNFFSGATATNSLNLSSMNIYGRYFLSFNSCVRVNLYLDNGTDIIKWFVQDDDAVLVDPLSQDKNEDKRITNYSDWLLSVGLQKFRGYGRLQGFYGFTVGVGQSRTKYKYEYGNAITDANQAPTTINNWSSGTTSLQSERTLEYDYGVDYRLHIGPTAGVEYYFAPKICIGAEASIVLDINLETESDYKNETWENGAVQEITVENTPGDLSRYVSSSGLGGAYYGGLYVMFHF